MNILIGVSSTIESGSGILTYTKNMIESLLSDDHHIFVVILVGGCTTWLDDRNVTFLEVDPDGNPVGEVGKVYSFHARHGIDVVINNDNCYLQQIASHVSSKFVFVLHLAKYSILALAKINTDYVDLFVATTNDMQFVLSQMGVPSSRIVVVHNSLSIKNAPKPLSTNSLEQMIKKKVLFAGEYTRRKGADLVVDLVNNYHMPDVEFIWCAPESKKIIKKLNDLNSVTVVDRLKHSEFIKLLPTFDFILMPSRSEGLPMLILEAASKGIVPIVSNGFGGLKDFVVHGDCGYILELRNWPCECSVILNDSCDKLVDRLKFKVVERFNCGFSNGRFAREIVGVASVIPKRSIMNSKNLIIYNWHRKPLSKKSWTEQLKIKVANKMGFISKFGSLELQE